MPKGSEFGLVPCKGTDCKAKIILAKDENGKTIPLHPSPPVYRVWKKGVVNSCMKIDGTTYVSHFATCRNIDQLRGVEAKAKTKEPDLSGSDKQVMVMDADGVIILDIVTSADEQRIREVVGVLTRGEQS